MTRSFVPGPAGNIEILVESIPDALATAIICHPHPLYGGSMHDTVVAALGTAFARAHITPLRFNFRGVGQSDGDFDKGVGEVQDVLSIADWLRPQAGTGPIYLAGYSFGAGIALAAAQALADQSLAAKSMVVVAPPLQMIVPPVVATLALLGGKDQIVPAKPAATALAVSSCTRVRVLDSADHFFGDELDTITALTEEFLLGT